jgi:hypothetical protein
VWWIEKVNKRGYRETTAARGIKLNGWNSTKGGEGGVDQMAWNEGIVKVPHPPVRSGYGWWRKQGWVDRMMMG